jgi:hypothetical protein
MKQSPIAEVKERFGDKAGLVKAVRDLSGGGLWIDRVNEDKGLDRVSNAKLLHLHAVLTDVKQAFGSRKGLIDACLELEKRTKDEGYRTRLDRWPLPRLWDHYRAVKRRSDRAARASASAAGATA